MRFKDAVLKANPKLDHVPSGFHRYGHVMVLRSSDTLSQELGETILSLYSWCTSVYQHQTTTGESRIPHLVHLAGIDTPVVRHKENGVMYEIDLAQITFSGGNRRLRERLANQVQDGEFLLDMFAAVGNLSLQPLVHNNISALLIERNPHTFSYLQKNLELNSLPVNLAQNADCRSLSLSNRADRILMGYHEVDRSHLSVAINALKQEGIIHLHPIVPIDDHDEASRRYETIFHDLGVEISEVKSYTVKDFAPGLHHLELQYTLSK